MKQLRVYKKSDGDISIKCPRCDELVVPEKNPIGLDGYDCPECNQVIHEGSLSSWKKAVRIAGEDE